MATHERGVSSSERKGKMVFPMNFYSYKTFYDLVTDYLFPLILSRPTFSILQKISMAFFLPNAASIV